MPNVNGQPTDIIPSINPNAAALMNGFIPLANDGIDGYREAPSLPTNFREEQIRVDQNISDKASLFVRVTNDGRTASPIHRSCGRPPNTIRARPF